MTTEAETTNWARIVRWAFTVLLACLPFLVTLVPIVLVEELTTETLSRQPELLYIPLVLGASALADTLLSPDTSDDLLLQTFAVLSLLMAVFSGVLYGVHFAVVNIRGPKDLGLPLFFEAALILMGVSIIATTIVQWRMAQNEPTRYA